MFDRIDLPSVSALVLIFTVSGIVSAALIVLLRPLLVRYALARPNARSSHRQPTPQGGGIAVIAATIVVVAAVTLLAPGVSAGTFRLAWVAACVVGLAAVGAIDDMRPIDPLPRLVLQGLAVVAVVAMLPSGLRIIDPLPWWVERALIFVAVLWLVNLVNFMDGIDWITVAEVVPITAALALFGMMGALPSDATLVALALCGATIGFAPFNRPVARLFLGDVGSLPIGLALGWLLALLAAGHLAAALLLPLYYVADATVTLLLRVSKGEPVMQAHRSHFYQRAFDGGLSVYQIVGRVFWLNIALIVLATATLLSPSRPLHVAAVAAGCVLVARLLYSFARVKR